MSKHILILAGDGIGPEIVGAAEKVLTKVNDKFNLGLTWEHGLLGGSAIDAHGEPYPAVTSEQAKKADLPEEWKKGVQNVQNLLLKALKDHNLEIIDPLNQDFDPRIAEAVGMVTVDTPDLEGKVVSVFQKGYKVYDKVIRPAKVQVGKHG